MRRVIVRIDTLVLKGFRHEERHAITRRLREQLMRTLSSHDVVKQLGSLGPEDAARRIGKGLRL